MIQPTEDKGKKENVNKGLKKIIQLIDEKEEKNDLKKNPVEVESKSFPDKSSKIRNEICLVPEDANESDVEMEEEDEE